MRRENTRMISKYNFHFESKLETDYKLLCGGQKTTTKNTHSSLIARLPSSVRIAERTHHIFIQQVTGQTDKRLYVVSVPKECEIRNSKERNARKTKKYCNPILPFCNVVHLPNPLRKEKKVRKQRVISINEFYI